MFDVLTYEKGASVLRMLEQYIGPTVFRDGVRRYLDRHAFGNTETADLWRALGEASELPIPEVMDGWIFHPGYPLIDVAKTAEGRVVLRQRRFLYLGDEAGAAEEPVWRTPVQLRFLEGGAGRPEQTLLSGGEAVTFEMGHADAVLVNAGGHGFYRVRYTPDLLAPLLGALDRLEAIERFNLVNDAWASVLAGLTPVAEFLDLTKHFRGERDKNVWSVIVGAFQTLNRMSRAAVAGAAGARPFDAGRGGTRLDAARRRIGVDRPAARRSSPGARHDRRRCEHSGAGGGVVFRSFPRRQRFRGGRGDPGARRRCGPL